MKVANVTGWFGARYYTPGQPGVFEVNPTHNFDSSDSPRRFSFWNGVSWGPVEATPEDAYSNRLGEVSLLVLTINSFRGRVCPQ